jgi:hypothetical protein
MTNLEERGLGGVEPCVARRNNNINWSNQTDTSRSSNLFGLKRNIIKLKGLERT